MSIDTISDQLWEAADGRPDDSAAKGHRLGRY